RLHVTGVQTCALPISVSVVCTDKTGTLTRNEMMVAFALVARRALTVTGMGYAPDGGLHDAQASPANDKSCTASSHPQDSLVDPRSEERRVGSERSRRE